MDRRIAVLLLTAACGSAGADTAMNAPVIDTAANGVINVTNTGPTLWTGTDGWRLVEELVISPPEGSEGELSYARGIVADAAGNVFSLEAEPATIKMFGPDGEWIRNIGREGDGPGEFRGGMLGVRGDTIVIQDSQNSRMSTFLTDGTYLAAHRSQCCLSSSGTLPVLSDGRAAINGFTTDGEQPQIFAYLTDMSGNATDTVAGLGTLYVGGQEVRDPSVWNVSRVSGNSSSMIVLNVPNYPSDVDRWRGDGARIVGNTATYSIALVDFNGDTTLIFTAPAPALSITMAERDSLYEAEITDVDESWRAAIIEASDPSDIPTTRPAWNNFTSDSEHRIWVARPDPDSDGELLDVFTSEGVLLGTLLSPDERITRAFWVGDRVYLRGTNEDDLPTIRVFRLETDSGS